MEYNSIKSFLADIEERMLEIEEFDVRRDNRATIETNTSIKESRRYHKKNNE